jgi:hypothetical protein
MQQIVKLSRPLAFPDVPIVPRDDGDGKQGMCCKAKRRASLRAVSLFIRCCELQCRSVSLPPAPPAVPSP